MLYLYTNDERSNAIRSKLDFIQSISDNNSYDIQMNKIVCQAIIRDDIQLLSILKKEGYNGWNDFHMQLVCCTGKLDIFIFFAETCGCQVQPLLHLSYAAERNFVNILIYAYEHFSIDSSWNILYAYARNHRKKEAEEFCLKCAIECAQNDSEVETLTQLISDGLSIDIQSISI